MNYAGTAPVRAWVEVDISAIKANVSALRAAISAETLLMAVVKANAYGHGIVPVARAAVEAGAQWLGVAAVSEGIALRIAGLHSPIALLCVPLPCEAAAIIAYRLTAAIGDMATLQALAAAARPDIARGEAPQVHIEVDTGMRRSGVPPYEVIALWRSAIEAGLNVTGLTTHLADADGANTNFTVLQELYFEQARAALTAEGARFELIHQCNSAATIRFPKMDSHLVRPGLLLYGIYPPIPGLTATVRQVSAHADVKANSEAATDAPEPTSTRLTPVSPAQIEARVRAGELPAVRPALALKARVATVRALKVGHHVGYGATRRLTRPSLVATVLIGYGDGYPRRLSNRGVMLLRGQRAPILGRVCMDQTMVDVTDIPGVSPDEEAVCIGAQGNERITVEEIASLIDTTEHEITTCLTERLPRIYL